MEDSHPASDSGALGSEMQQPSARDTMDVDCDTTATPRFWCRTGVFQNFLHMQSEHPITVHVYLMTTCTFGAHFLSRPRTQGNSWSLTSLLGLDKCCAPASVTVFAQQLEVTRLFSDLCLLTAHWLTMYACAQVHECVRAAFTLADTGALESTHRQRTCCGAILQGKNTPEAAKQGGAVDRSEGGFMSSFMSKSGILSAGDYHPLVFHASTPIRPFTLPCSLRGHSLGCVCYEWISFYQKTSSGMGILT